MSALLQLEGVGKAFGAARVLRTIDLTVDPGEIVVLIGGSGSGKTTLVRLVAGLERADTGVVTLRGETVDDPASGRFVRTERRRLGMVFQDYALWPHMSGYENVEAALGAEHRGETSRRRAAMGLLDEVGLSGLAARRPAELSGGQQQRVGLARALAAASDLLLLDEPLSSLDVDVRDRLRERIRTLVRARGGAALLVSHDPLDAWRLADRVVVLEGGRVVQAATPPDLYARPASARVARFTDAVGGFEVRLVSREGRLGFDWGGVFQPAQAVGVQAGQAGCAYVRPAGVRHDQAGAPVDLIDLTFESGAWRAIWGAAGTAGRLHSIERSPPPPSARLIADPAHVFVFPPEQLS